MADPYDLEARRQRIEQLYMHESRSLAEVRQVLRDEGCLASRAMFLKKIRAWGLQKNNNWNDMIDLLQQMQINQASDVFLVRGRRVTRDQILSYFSRKQVQFPILVQPDSLNQQNLFFNATYSFQLHLSKLPLELVPVESSLYSIYSTSFVTGMAFMNKNQPAQGGAMFEKGFSEIQKAIHKPITPLDLQSIFWIVRFMEKGGHPQLSPIFVQFLYQASVIALGMHHGFTEFLRALMRIRTFTELLESASRLCSDVNLQNIGASHTIGVQSRLSSIRTYWLSKPVEEIIKMYFDFLKEGSDMTIEDEIRTRAVLSDYLSIHARQRGRAIEVLMEISEILMERNDYDSINTTLKIGILMVRQAEDENWSQEKRLETFRRAQVYTNSAMDRTVHLQYGSNEHIFVMQQFASFHAQWGNPVEAQERYLQVVAMLEQFKLNSTSPGKGK